MIIFSPCQVGNSWAKTSCAADGQGDEGEQGVAVGEGGGAEAKDLGAGVGWHGSVSAEG